MTTLTMSQARDKFADCADDVYFRDKRICVKRRGKPVLMMVPVKDYELLQEMKKQRAVDATVKSLKRGKFVTMEVDDK
jgi:prevent-host-death family protein